jgi:hypothetical protein
MGTVVDADAAKAPLVVIAKRRAIDKVFLFMDRNLQKSRFRILV